jgi:hypothetical protein
MPLASHPTEAPRGQMPTTYGREQVRLRQHPSRSSRHVGIQKSITMAERCKVCGFNINRRSDGDPRYRWKSSEAKTDKCSADACDAG